MLPSVINACITGRQYPHLNASHNREGVTAIIEKYYYHTGIVVNTPAGLMVQLVTLAKTKGIFNRAIILSSPLRLPLRVWRAIRPSKFSLGLLLPSVL